MLSIYSWVGLVLLQLLPQRTTTADTPTPTTQNLVAAFPREDVCDDPAGREDGTPDPSTDPCPFQINVNSSAYIYGHTVHGKCLVCVL